MSSTPFSIISSEFSIYVGLPIVAFGIIGNVINLGLLFSTRRNPCSFLLFVSSFFNLIALSVGLLPRALSIGFNIDASSTNLIWCKSRLFISYIGTITSLTCICFASIDRYFLSCRTAKWRNRSKVSTAKMATLIAISIIVVSNVPFLLFYTIIEVKSGTGNITTKCSVINPGLVLYVNNFVRPVLLGILPGTILGITGWLTYRNITSITGIQLRATFQRSLTSMVFFQIVTIVVPIIPFATFNIYQVLTSSVAKTSYRLSQEALILDITNIILYISYASNFYIYVILVSSYRRDFLEFARFLYDRNHWNNRVGPMVRQQHELQIVSIKGQLPRSA